MVGELKKGTSFHDLTEGVVAEILIKAASNAPEDYANARLSCKLLRDTSNAFHIFKNIDFPERYRYPLRQAEVNLKLKCLQNKNPKVLFEEGAYRMFRDYPRMEKGYQLMREAVAAGFVPAIYMLGIVMLSFRGEDNNKGLQILRSLTLSARKGK
ncbi:hypothetical protein COLO4_24327 [Corchorus olitorius]|uniref:At2g35280-like TPR domain-containing protein n=1 Tax=Corchorus olitorius TaxID=93759 RepID=A0A1R3IAZ1_9ROSI|nr:hypothetical protein COLO4_24327 [Corchorus olitorius]